MALSWVISNLAASYISYKFHASYLTWCKRIVQFPLANIGFPRSWTVLSRTLQEYPQPFCLLEVWYWKIEFPIFYIYIYREREISNLISRSYDLNTTNINHAGPRGWNYTFGIVWDHRMGLFKSHDRLRVSINPPPTQRPAMWFRTVSTITDTPALVHLQEPVTCADLWKLGNIYIYIILYNII